MKRPIGKIPSAAPPKPKKPDYWPEIPKKPYVQLPPIGTRFTEKEIMDAVWDELDKMNFLGEGNERYYEISGIISKALKTLNEKRKNNITTK